MIYDENVSLSHNLSWRDAYGIDVSAKSGSGTYIWPDRRSWLSPGRGAATTNVLDDLNNNLLAFVVHVGDLSSPPYACTDDLVARRFAQFSASAHPFIYTPGDNEWTDCHEQQGVKGGNPLERLAHVRKVFFAGEQSLGQRTMPLVHQSESSDPVLQKYRENVR